MKIRVLVIDDEDLARDRLKSLLKAESEVEVVGECRNGEEALDAIQKEKPDLIFLDVQMPELDGFEVVEALEPNERPAVIFVTAHDQFALKAFDIHAIDYLLKPFDRERLHRAIERALTRIAAREKAPDPGLNALLSDVRKQPKAAERVVVKTSGRLLLLRPEEIDWVEAADNYVTFHVGNDHHMSRETMTAVEDRLSATRFLRISRSTIVNLERIKELHPLFHGEYTVVLRNGAKLTLTRSYRSKLEILMGRLS